jgi:hypothetical protein
VRASSGVKVSVTRLDILRRLLQWTAIDASVDEFVK